MAKQSLDTLKSYFSSGKYPNQSNYEDLIDTLSESSGGTEYTAGNNITIENNVISATDTTYTASDFDINDLSDTNGLKSTWSNKQDQLTAGNNVDISNNVISATDTTYQSSDFDIKDLTDSTDLKSTWNNKQDRLTSGTNITIENNVISATGGDGLKQVDLTTYADGVEGEIVQHIGSTTEDYIHGYVYKLSQGHVTRYEDVTIPSGSTCIVYTNKFDSSVKKVYAIEDIELPYRFNIRYKATNELYVYDQISRSSISSSSDQFINLNQLTKVLSSSGEYMGPNNVVKYIFNSYRVSSLNDVNLDKIADAYNHIMSSGLTGGAREPNTESFTMELDDIIVRCILPRKNINTGDVISDSVVHIKLGDLKDCNWDLRSYLTLYQPSNYPLNDRYDYDESRSNIVKFQFEYLIFKYNHSVNGLVYYLANNSGAAGWDGNSLYKVVNESGDRELYIFENLLYCVSKGAPIEGFSSGTHDYSDNLDTELFFDYTAEIVTTSESVTIHKQIIEYDDIGLPILDPIGLLWQRINVQPAIQNDDLWTSVTD